MADDGVKHGSVALRDPPAEAIKVGYYLMKAREHVLKVPVIEAKDGSKHTVADYLWWAHQHAILAAPTVSEETGMYYMQPSTGQRLIMEAMAGLHKIGEAHDYFRRLMKEQGYRDITARDFAEYGSGGDR